MDELDLIVEGDVQGVGYRQYVAKVGRKLKLTGFVENLEDGTVHIQCKGPKKAIVEFKKKINQKNPAEAPLIYDESIAEMSQGFSTGMSYMNLSREENKANFKDMDENIERTEKNIESLLKILAEKKS